MQLLEAIVYLNQTLTKFFLLNTFAYEPATRRFRTNEVLRVCINVAQLVIVVPLLFVLWILTGSLVKKSIRITVDYDIQGLSTVLLFAEVTSTLRNVSKIFIVLQLMELFWFRLERVRGTLNAFIALYDEYTHLRHSVALSFNLCSYILLLANTLVIFWRTWLRQLSASMRSFSRLKPFVAFYYLLIIMQPLLAYSLVVLGVVLLHGFFCGARRTMQRRRRRRVVKSDDEIEQLVAFYSRLMRLRVDFEALASGIVNTDMLVLLLQLTESLFELYWQPYRLESFYCLCWLLPPLLLSQMSHEIAEVQQTLGNDLIDFAVKATATEPPKLSKSLASFCLLKLQLEGNDESDWDVLHWRRGYLLTFCEFALVYGIFLVSLMPYVGDETKQRSRIAR